MSALVVGGDDSDQSSRNLCCGNGIFVMPGYTLNDVVPLGRFPELVVRPRGGPVLVATGPDRFKFVKISIEHSGFEYGRTTVGAQGRPY